MADMVYDIEDNNFLEEWETRFKNHELKRNNKGKILPGEYIIPVYEYLKKNESSFVKILQIREYISEKFKDHLEPADLSKVEDNEKSVFEMYVLNALSYLKRFNKIRNGIDANLWYTGNCPELRKAER